jgi:hypothetical protein
MKGRKKGERNIYEQKERRGEMENIESMKEKNHSFFRQDLQR